MEPITSIQMLKSVMNGLSTVSTATVGQKIMLFAADGTPVGKMQAPTEEQGTSIRFELNASATASTQPSATAGDATMGLLYLVGPENGTKYQWITIEDDSTTPSTYSWLNIGSTNIDLSQYATLTVTDALAASLAALGDDVEALQKAVVEGAVYDVSAKNPTAGPNYDGKWESLSALLSDANLSTLIPTSVRKGGMSIKFVCSSDNKYAQYFLPKDEWSANEADWEKYNDVTTSNQLNSDFDIADDKGNVLVHIAEGHIKTKEFDSSKDATNEKRGLMSAEDKATLDTVEAMVNENDLPTAVPDSTASGEYIRYNNGTTATGVAASRIHDTYNVKEGDVYSIKMNSIGPTGAAIAFFDSADGYVKKCSIQGVINTILRLVIVIPKGVATMHICYVAPAIYVKKAIGVPSKLSAEDVSDVDYLPATPLEIVKDTPGYAAIFHRIGVIGGSFATGAQDYDLPTIDNIGIPENSVIQRLAAMYGGTAFNFSSGGMSARRWLTNTTIGGQSTKFTNNLVQGYFIQLGNNDLNDHYKDSTYELGTIDDVNVGNESANPDTFYGNLSKVIGRIRDVQPNAYVFLLTFVRGYNNQSYGTTIPPEFDYNTAIREIYQKYRAAADLPKGERTETLRFLLIDYYTYGKDWTFFRTGIHLDAYRRTHLSPTGYQYQAYELATYVDWLIKKDMEYFNDVAFVGTDKRTRDD